LKDGFVSTDQPDNPPLGIVRDPGVCGGEARIAGTRIPVWLLVQTHRLGLSESDLLCSFPGLRAENLADAWAYYRAHPTEIEQDIDENERA
jgi:uncharacterized protein (DUF433 family)